MLRARIASGSFLRLLSVTRPTRNGSRCSSSNGNVIESPHGKCPLPETSIVQRFFQVASIWPHRIAAECGLTGRAYSYEQLLQLSRQFGTSLARMGFRKGQVIGLCLPNVAEFPIALLGAALVGMPVSLVHPIYTADEIARQFQLSGACVVVGVSAMAGTMRQVAQLCPTVQRIILMGGSEEGFVSFQDMLNNTGPLMDATDDVDIHEDNFVLPSSSGTTGLPKCVQLTNASVATNIQQVMEPGTVNLKRATNDFHEIFICLLPFTHIYGLVVQMLSSLDIGGKLVTLPKFDVSTFLKTIHDYKPTTLHLVPPLFTILGQHPGLKIDSFARLHTIFSGAAPLGPTMATRLLERVNNPHLILQEGYGMTECSPGSHMSPMDNSKIGSIGNPMSRTSAKILDLDTGELLGPNQNGELCVLGPQIMKGYLNNAQATSEMIDPCGWLHTGDIGYYDQDGHFFIVDRLKELIKVKAHQVAPSELEDLIRRHPDVADVAVIGVPDDYSGELPRAYVVARAGAALTEESIQRFVHPQVAPYKQLKGGVQVVDAIPKSNTGKILRRELKTAFLSEK